MKQAIFVAVLVFSFVIVGVSTTTPQAQAKPTDIFDVFSEPPPPEFPPHLPPLPSANQLAIAEVGALESCVVDGYTFPCRTFTNPIAWDLENYNYIKLSGPKKAITYIVAFSILHEELNSPDDVLVFLILEKNIGLIEFIQIPYAYIPIVDVSVVAVIDITLHTAIYNYYDPNQELLPQVAALRDDGVGIQ